MPKSRFSPPLACGRLTPFYDAVSAALGFGRQLPDRVVALAKPRAGERLLDLGSGTGTLLARLHASRPSVALVGLEPDQRALAIARAKWRAQGTAPSLVRGAGQHLPFADQSFDVVTSTLVFHHLPTASKAATIAEVRRVLREGGRFLLADFGRPQGLGARVLFGVLSLFDGRENMRANLRGELPRLLADQGFVVQEVVPPYRGVHFLLAVPRPERRLHASS